MIQHTCKCGGAQCTNLHDCIKTQLYDPRAHTCRTTIRLALSKQARDSTDGKAIQAQPASTPLPVQKNLRANLYVYSYIHCCLTRSLRVVCSFAHRTVQDVICVRAK